MCITIVSISISLFFRSLTRASIGSTVLYKAMFFVLCGHLQDVVFHYVDVLHVADCSSCFSAPLLDFFFFLKCNLD